MSFDFDILNEENYREDFIKNYKTFNKIWENIHILDCEELKTLKNLKTKCYFGRGSYPSFISSWEVKTNALLYDTFIFDANVFRFIVAGHCPPNLDDENDIWHFNSPVDLKASSFLIDLYNNGSVKLVGSSYIWNNMMNSSTYGDLKDEDKLYTDKTEIEAISKSAALFPSDESNYPGLLHMMNEDIMTSFLTDSSIITKEYSSYIKRKLNEFDQSKFNILNFLLEYEVPNFASLDYHKISNIRKLKSLSNLRNKIEESSQNIAENTSNVEDSVQNLRDELWKLALDNIQDCKSKIIVESLISNVPPISLLISVGNALKINKMRKHWGYTILNLKKN